MPRPYSGHAPALLLCTLLAIAHTWPLATAPGALSLNAHADVMLNEWILAWVAHQLATDPLRLFDANTFHPARHSLAFSEPLILPALLGAPLAWAGASPVLVHNLLLIGGFALTAAAAYALAFSWTRDRGAALVTASAFAFNTHTLARLAHIQGIHLYAIPLVLLSLERLMAAPTRRAAAWLAVWMIALAYTSGYLIVFGTVALAVLVVVRVRTWRLHARRLWIHLAFAAAAAGLAILPVYLPYRWVAREYGMARSLEQVAQFSATPGGFLATVGRVHQDWSARFATDPGINAFFAGFLVIALAAVAAALSWPRTQRVARSRVVGALGLAAIGAILALGTATPLYGWLYGLFPPMQGLRVASRFGNLYLLGVALLAGVGLAILRTRVANRRASVALAAAAIAIVNLEAAIAPVAYQKFEGIPRVYALLRDLPEPVVLAEVPVFPPHVIFENAPYVFASTAHWKKIVNGYSGYTPPAYRELQPQFWHFPHPQAMQAMRAAGVTHVMIHPARLFAGATELVEESERSPDLERLAIGPAGMRLYRLRSAGESAR